MSIYDNEKPFGLMSPEDQAALRRHWTAGSRVEQFMSTGGWQPTPFKEPLAGLTYRAVRPAFPLPDWTWKMLHPDIKFIAMDKNGEWWGYTIMPAIRYHMFNVEFAHDFRSLTCLNLPTHPDWTQSLIERPKETEE